MELTQHFGDGQSTYHFFKDKGGRRNHMRLSVKTKKKFFIRLVFEDGLEIPQCEFLLKGVALLEIIVDGGIVEPYNNESGEEVLSQKMFAGDTEVAFRIMHVSRCHLDRNFRLQFTGVGGEVLQQTTLIYVRSKLKKHQTYPENSSGSQGSKRKRIPVCKQVVRKQKRSNTTTTIGQLQKKVKTIQEESTNFVHIDMFNQLMGHCVRMRQQLNYMSTNIANLSDCLETLGTLQGIELLEGIELLDPDIVHGFL